MAAAARAKAASRGADDLFAGAGDVTCHPDAWLYVVSGQLRLVLADHDLVLGAGEAAELDTRVPHGWGNAGSTPVEVLSLFGAQGERMHVRAKSRAIASSGARAGRLGSVAGDPLGG
ncbi:MAG: cupin domain-containing protein [Acidimicrobiia bacterium]|nr:cupin domain-containing protein [Acidimicrobiia bacterium]